MSSNAQQEYTIVLEKTGTGYSAFAPEVPGCVAAGATKQETTESMRAALTDHLELLSEHGMPLAPHSRAAESVVAESDPEYLRGETARVVVSAPPPRG